MKKFLSILVTTLFSVCAFAAKEVVPSDAVLNNYYQVGQVCVCIYVPGEMACNDIVFTGTYNGWSDDLSKCAKFEAVEGYDGWYVVAFFDTTVEPDPERGLQGKPIIKDGLGSFNWSYQVGEATIIRGGVQVIEGIPGEIDLVNYSTNAPNVFTVDAWKYNPCTAVYHNYKISVYNAGCDGYVVPFLVGDMNNWKFTQMQYDDALSTDDVNVFSISFKAAEGSRYQVVSGLMDDEGEIASAPSWTDDAYIQILKDGNWQRITTQEGSVDLLTGADPNIVFDLRPDTIRWARCIPEEVAQTRVITVTVPNCCTAIPTIAGSFNDWNATELPMTLVNDFTYTYTLNALNTDAFKFASSTNGWSNQIQKYDTSTSSWKDIDDITFGEQTEIILDYSNSKQYKWSFCEDVDQTKPYDFEKNGCYYNIISISDLTVELTGRYEYDPINDYLYSVEAPTYSGDFRIPETVEYSNRTFSVVRVNSFAFIYCDLGTLTIPATVKKWTYDGFGTCQNIIIEDSEVPMEVESKIMDNVLHSVYLGRNLRGGRISSNKEGEYSTIIFGNNVTGLDGIFTNNNNLTSVTLPPSVKYLSGTFYGCKNLTSVSGEGVESLLNHAFDRSGIQTINMPNLKKIEVAFQECTSLQTINIPEGVVWLEGSDKIGGVFTNTVSLTSVSIPATVLSIANLSFLGCTSLQTISVAHATPIDINENTFDMLTYLNATLKVPLGSKSAYMNAPVWSNFLNIVEDASLVATLATVGVSKENGEFTITFSQGGTSCQVDERTYYTVPIGSTMTITLQPEDNYVLSSLIINNEDVTDKVADNVYNIIITRNATFIIYASFEYNSNPNPDPDPDPEPQTKDAYIIYVDNNMEYINHQDVTLYLPTAPVIEGFTFIGWRPVAEIIADYIRIQAIYTANAPSATPSVVVNPSNSAQKLIRNGNVYILTDDKVYTITGQEVK